MASCFYRGRWRRISSNVVVVFAVQWVDLLSRHKSYHNANEKVITKENYKKTQCSFRNSSETRGTTVPK